MIPDLDTLRSKGLRLLVLTNWLFTAVLAVFWLFDLAPDADLLLIGSGVANLIPSWMALRGRHDLAARMAAAVMIVVQPAALVAISQGGEWQMDMHMYFFANLAALTILCDWRPIVLASALIAVHHLFLNWFAPGLVFTGSANFERVLIHAVAVVLQAGALSIITVRLRALIVGQEASRIEAADLAEATEEARARAEALRVRAESALAAAEEADRRAAHEAAENARLKAEAEAARQTELMSVADEFERSISGVATAIVTAASQLEGFSRDLNRLARDTGREASDAAASADQASTTARSVAGAISHLSNSIADIADNADQQARLSLAARGSSIDGDSAVRALAKRTTDISGFVEMIRGVASQTNLLALNATIEAARAGDAGRGFAVVASEVKQLAGEASSITVQIGDLITAIHDGAGNAETRLAEIANAVASLDGAASAIRAAIGEQRRTAATIDDHARATASGADDIARRIAAVAEAVRSAEDLSEQVSAASAELLSSAQLLTGATGTFVTTLRAA